MFPKHKIETHLKDLVLGTEYLVWAEPGTPTGRLEYLLDGMTLLVTGDYGAAVYQWSGERGTRFELADIAKFELDYLCEKCTASPVGLPFRQWFPDLAEKWLAEWFSTGRSQAQRNVRFRQLHGLEALEQQEVWERWLRDYGGDIFGEDAHELGDIGSRIHEWCRVHHRGLRTALLVGGRVDLVGRSDGR